MTECYAMPTTNLRHTAAIACHVETKRQWDSEKKAYKRKLQEQKTKLDESEAKRLRLERDMMDRVQRSLTCMFEFWVMDTKRLEQELANLISKKSENAEEHKRVKKKEGVKQTLQDQMNTVSLQIRKNFEALKSQLQKTKAEIEQGKTQREEEKERADKAEQELNELRLSMFKEGEKQRQMVENAPLECQNYIENLRLELQEAQAEIMKEERERANEKQRADKAERELDNFKLCSFQREENYKQTAANDRMDLHLEIEDLQSARAELELKEHDSVSSPLTGEVHQYLMVE